jgi:hypothetical protein
MSGGAKTALALTYYFQTPGAVWGPRARSRSGFVSSLENGKTWTAPERLSDPMELGWLAPTNHGERASRVAGRAVHHP